MWKKSGFQEYTSLIYIIIRCICHAENVMLPAQNWVLAKSAITNMENDRAHLEKEEQNVVCWTKAIYKKKAWQRIFVGDGEASVLGFFSLFENLLLKLIVVHFIINGVDVSPENVHCVYLHLAISTLTYLWICRVSNVPSRCCFNTTFSVISCAYIWTLFKTFP